MRGWVLGGVSSRSLFILVERKNGYSYKQQSIKKGASWFMSGFFLVSLPYFEHGSMQCNHRYKSPQLLNDCLLHVNIFVMIELLL